MRSFIDRHGISFDSVVDREGEIFERYGIPSQPAWVFIDTDGTLTRVRGSLDAESIANYVDDLSSGA